MHGRLPPEPGLPAAAPAPRPARLKRRRPLSLRTHLVLLILAVLLPSLLLGAAALVQAVAAHRGAVEAQVRGTARALALAVDREMAALLAAADTLADMRSADPTDDALPLFLDRARRLAKPLSGWVVVQDPATGAVLGSTVADAALVLPDATQPHSPQARAVAAGHPVASDLVRNPATRQAAIGAAAPVLLDGHPHAVVSIWTDPERLSDMLADQELPPDGFATLTDTQGRVVARSADHARFLGQRVGRFGQPDFLTERVGRSRNIDGAEVLIATQPLDGPAGWMMAVGEPWSRFYSAQAASILRLGLGGLVALGLGAAVAVLLARRILRPVQALAWNAKLVANGPATMPRPVGVAELDALARAIVQARATLADRAAAAALAEAEARTQRDLLRSVLDATAEPVTAKNRRGQYVLANHAAQRSLAPDSRTLVGLHVRDIMPAAHAELALEQDQKVLRSGQPVTYEHRAETLLGAREFITTKVPWRGPDGGLLGVVAVSHDVTEARQAQAHLAGAQARLLQVSRLGATAAMAAGLAHEINQPLTAAANYLHAGARLLGPAGAAPPSAAELEAAREALPEAATQAVRAGEILRRLRGFVARGETERHAVPVARLLRDAEAVLRAAAGSAAGLALQLDAALEEPGAPLVLVDAVQMQQVLFNLVRNAAESMQAGPVRKGQAALVLLQAGLDSEGIALRVIDRGAGVGAAVLPHLFEPFITTKANGLGVGLAICRTVVEAHGGTLAYAPNPDGGSIFTIVLQPVAARPAEPGRVPIASEARHG
jgi:two-component system sensor kinase FixL